jgi:hypothetical protein
MRDKQAYETGLRKDLGVRKAYSPQCRSIKIVLALSETINKQDD